MEANCTNGDIRLANSATKYQGRVEVCYHGNWGTVCDDGWDNNDARVVCNQLGFTGTGTDSTFVYTGPMFGLRSTHSLLHSTHNYTLLKNGI